MTITAIISILRFLVTMIKFTSLSLTAYIYINLNLTRTRTRMTHNL